MVGFGVEEPVFITVPAPFVPTTDVRIVPLAYFSHRARLSALPFLISRSYDVLIASVIIPYVLTGWSTAFPNDDAVSIGCMTVVTIPSTVSSAILYAPVPTPFPTLNAN